MKKWYKVYLCRAHKGFETCAFIFEDNPIAVFDRYRTMRGVKRNNPTIFPDISPLSSKEELVLEEKIVTENRISLHEAKTTWYYPCV